jgi:hypothetical protein
LKHREPTPVDIEAAGISNYECLGFFKPDFEVGVLDVRGHTCVGPGS